MLILENLTDIKETGRMDIWMALVNSFGTVVVHILANGLNHIFMARAFTSFKTVHPTKALSIIIICMGLEF